MTNYESKLWSRIRDMMGSQWWAARVESPMTPGFPDVVFAIGQVSGWIELKSTQKYERIVTLSEPQLAWLHHGNAWLIWEIRSENQIWLISGKEVRNQHIHFTGTGAVPFVKVNLKMITGMLEGLIP